MHFMKLHSTLLYADDVKNTKKYYLKDESIDKQKRNSTRNTNRKSMLLQDARRRTIQSKFLYDSNKNKTSSSKL